MRKSLLSVLLVCPLILAGCSSTEEAGSTDSAAIVVENCGNTVELDGPPERVVLQKAPAVLTLDALGVLDRVVAKAGAYPEEYYSDEINAKLDEIETLSDRLDASGHLEITKEAIIAQDPDLIIGFSDTVNDDTVTEAAIVDEAGYCEDTKEASFDDIYDHIDLYATLFGREERGEAYKKEIAAELEGIDSTAGAGETVAIVYPTEGGGTLYAYGTGSMSHPIVEAVGLTNVFADESDRVFEISAEQLVAANPDRILVLHQTDDSIIEEVYSLQGADTITAVQKGQVTPMLFNYFEPATPLALDGIKLLQEELR
ncbi:ABC transporter substrate-binding protein [Corynebacterium cystitidis]|uniref:Iron complex transport system substrate-binding protein n=1 Tax=Corynebacterium cystitidis DSM 20524 TaxID=1121357 RepID=A0A1H9VVU4_9CORY|nr:ABC transporter substrate-binding protein [Corynebacterium cystitidis]WJY81117.1 Fe(3+)-citrate-binding protein YfmC precursor [Corynebacterium cystitidis DSM 20524]SES25413.1 iron complex transport system substrate-binding protein [Corynebacterium cystitidis DSM 20524]SNV89890.1 ABC-type transporter, periplasmic component [Corynebacterium cystitidis]